MNELDDLHNKIGQLLVDAGPANAMKIIARAKLSLDGESCEYEYDYLDQEGDEDWFVPDKLASHDYAGQQSRTGVTALDGFWWLRSLNYTVAPAAGQFWANRFDYPERGVDDIQLFRDAFSQRFQFAAADGAFGFCRGDNLPVTGKCCRKCFADGRV